MGELRVGHARIDITPPVGCRMMGYASRTEGAKGIHDPLTASVLWLADADRQAILVAYDLSALDENTVADLRAAIAGATGLGDEEMLFNTSHTHAGPVVAGRPGMPLSNEYIQFVAEQTAKAACSARDELAPCILRAGSAPLDIGTNRRQRQPDGTVRLGANPDGPSLRELTLWVFEREGLDDIGLFSLPLHGTTMGGNNLYISAEWMGSARTQAEENSPGRRLMFVQGCGGDQNPYRDSGDFAQAEAHGRKTASAIAEAWEDAKEIEGTPLRLASRICEGPVADGGVWPVPVAGLRLGQAALVGMAGEACVAYAFYARGISPALSTMALGYTNGSMGYLPTAQILAEGGYEATANHYFRVGRPWAPEIEERLRETIQQALFELMD